MLALGMNYVWKTFVLSTLRCDHTEAFSRAVDRVQPVPFMMLSILPSVLTGCIL